MPRESILRGILAAAVFAGGFSASASAAIIEAFEGVAGFSTFADTGSTVTLSNVPGLSGNALQLTYDMSVGSYAGVTRSYGAQDYAATGANALRFSYRATGPSNTGQISFVDDDDPVTVQADNLVYKFPLATDNAWRQLTVPLTDFITFPLGDLSFNLAGTAKFIFGVTKDNGAAGSGSVFFDAFHLVRVDQATSMIDSSENSIPGCVTNSTLNTCVNERVGPQAIIYFQGGAASGYSAVVSTQIIKGAKNRELKCTLAGGFCGVAEELGGMSVRGNESLRFFAQGIAGSEPLKLEVKDVNNVTFSTNVTGIVALNFTTHTFTFAAIAAAQPTMDLNALKEVVFVFDTAGLQTVHLDDLAVIGPAAAAADLAVVDDFAADLVKTNYVTAAPTQAAVGLSYVNDHTSPGAGADNRVAEIDYTFAVDPSTPFAVAEKALGINLLADPEVRFRFQGDGGNQDLEVKVADADGTVYLKKFAGVTDTNGAWKTTSVPVDQFSFNALGNDALLDLRNITKVDFAVTVGQSASGTLALDTLESVPSVAFQKSSLGSVVTAVSTPFNPFSPNGDGVADSFRLVYTLNQTARVILRLYRLNGSLVKTFDAGDQPAGDHALDWDGLGDDGRRVGNGICLYALEADGVIDGKQTFKEIVGVLR